MFFGIINTHASSQDELDKSLTATRIVEFEIQLRGFLCLVVHHGCRLGTGAGVHRDFQYTASLRGRVELFNLERQGAHVAVEPYHEKSYRCFQFKWEHASTATIYLPVAFACRTLELSSLETSVLDSSSPNSVDTEPVPTEAGNVAVHPPSYSRGDPAVPRVDPVTVLEGVEGVIDGVAEVSANPAPAKEPKKHPRLALAQASFPQLSAISLLGAGLAFQTYFQAKSGGGAAVSQMTLTYLAWSWVTFILAVVVSLVWQVAVSCGTCASGMVFRCSLVACTASLLAGATMLSLALVQDAGTFATRLAGWIFPALIACAVIVSTVFVVPFLFTDTAKLSKPPVSIDSMLAQAQLSPLNSHLAIEVHEAGVNDQLPPPPFTSSPPAPTFSMADFKPPQPRASSSILRPTTAYNAYEDFDPDGEDYDEDESFSITELLQDDDTLHTFVLCYAAFRKTLELVRASFSDFDMLEYVTRAPMLLTMHVASEEGTKPTIVRDGFDPVVLGENDLDTLADFLRHLDVWELALREVWSEGFPLLRPAQMATLLREAHNHQMLPMAEREG
ncbi:hypothetical protein BKA62DRAFT_197041 [Auriculariales sp. MPI-PUGE-AT-0066]|nr:hypothetical protein BKA62DRAFT_197041 [Auriculariales sp. MPI-PUGE-AT-0066]